MRALWRVMEGSIPERQWFVTRFMVAAETVVDRWAPLWARARVLGRPVGVWLLVAAWSLVPLIVALGF